MTNARIKFLIGILFFFFSCINAYADNFPYFKKYANAFPAQLGSIYTVISTSDLDNDGFNDFALAASPKEHLQIIYGDPNFKFSRQLLVTIPGSGHKSGPPARHFTQHIFADVNRDGIADLLELEIQNKTLGVATDTLVLRLGEIKKYAQNKIVHGFSQENYAFPVNDKMSAKYINYNQLEVLDFDQDGDLDLSCIKTYSEKGVNLSNTIVFENRGSSVKPNEQFIVRIVSDTDGVRYSGQRFYNDLDNNPEAVLTSASSFNKSDSINIYKRFTQGQFYGYQLKNSLKTEGSQAISKVLLTPLSASGYDGLLALTAKEISRIEYFQFDQKLMQFKEYTTISKSQDTSYKMLVTLHTNNDGKRDLVALGDTCSGEVTGPYKCTSELFLIKNKEPFDGYTIDGNYSLKDIFNDQNDSQDSRVKKLLQGDFNGDGFDDLLIESNHHYPNNTGENKSEMRTTILANHGDWGIAELGRSLEFISLNPLTNWSGKYQEKWLQSLNYNHLNSGWYFILPNGNIYRWQKQTGKELLKNELISKVDVSYYKNLKALIYAGHIQSDTTSQNQPSPKTFVHKYQISTNGNFQEDWFGKGLKERWIISKVLGNLYVLQDGRVYKYVKGKDPKSLLGHVLIEAMGKTFYNELGQFIPKK